PVWNPNGRELFYRRGKKMMAVDIATQPGFAPGTPRVLFEGGDELVSPGANYDVSPDGQRFLMIKSNEQQSAPTQINVVLNWFAENRRADFGGTGSGTRERHHSPRPEARQRKGHAGGQGQGFGLRLGKGVRGRRSERRSFQFTDAQYCGDDARSDSGNGGVHESG